MFQKLQSKTGESAEPEHIVSIEVVLSPAQEEKNEAEKRRGNAYAIQKNGIRFARVAAQSPRFEEISKECPGKSNQDSQAKGPQLSQGLVVEVVRRYTGSCLVRFQARPEERIFSETAHAVEKGLRSSVCRSPSSPTNS